MKLSLILKLRRRDVFLEIEHGAPALFVIFAGGKSLPGFSAKANI
ncbi:MAG TPA: hypothetical protein VF721_12470 [Pyrinomonadaceae bacterium]|jgi:hypothetical protein